MPRVNIQGSKQSRGVELPASNSRLVLSKVREKQKHHK